MSWTVNQAIAFSEQSRTDESHSFQRRIVSAKIFTFSSSFVSTEQFLDLIRLGQILKLFTNYVLLFPFPFLNSTDIKEKLNHINVLWHKVCRFCVVCTKEIVRVQRTPPPNKIVVKKVSITLCGNKKIGVDDTFYLVFANIFLLCRCDINWMGFLSCENSRENCF